MLAAKLPDQAVSRPPLVDHAKVARDSLASTSGDEDNRDPGMQRGDNVGEASGAGHCVLRIDDDRIGRVAPHRGVEIVGRFEPNDSNVEAGRG